MDDTGLPLSKVCLTLEAHSQGGIIAENISNNLTQKYTLRIHPRTLGSGHVITGEVFGSSKIIFPTKILFQDWML